MDRSKKLNLLSSLHANHTGEKQDLIFDLSTTDRTLYHDYKSTIFNFLIEIFKNEERTGVLYLGKTNLDCYFFMSHFQMHMNYKDDLSKKIQPELSMLKINNSKLYCLKESSELCRGIGARIVITNSTNPATYNRIIYPIMTIPRSFFIYFSNKPCKYVKALEAAYISNQLENLSINSS